MTYDENSLQPLARLVKDAMVMSIPYDYFQHGMEVIPGFFWVYNEKTGQSKRVFLHEESGFVFKNYYRAGRWTASGAYICEYQMDGFNYPVRLPKFYVFDSNIVAQEYIGGVTHYCTDHHSCEHTIGLAKVTGYNDCHNGNWKIFNNEIVLFDFD